MLGGEALASPSRGQAEGPEAHGPQRVKIPAPTPQGLTSPNASLQPGLGVLGF